MHRSHADFGLDLAAITRAAGFADAQTITDQAGVETMARGIGRRGSGRSLYVVRIKAENLPRSLPSRDAV